MDAVTNAELFRLVSDLRAEHRAATADQNRKLDAIEEQVRKTNGQVIAHDGRIKNLEREVFTRRPTGAAVPKGTVSFSWSPDAKTVLAILGAAATVLALIAKEWAKR